MSDDPIVAFLHSDPLQRIFDAGYHDVRVSYDPPRGRTLNYCVSFAGRIWRDRTLDGALDKAITWAELHPNKKTPTR